MSREAAEKTLQKYIPEEAVPTALEWLFSYKFHLRITKSRKTKLGDYRAPYKEKGHRISVNGDLNPYAFLITLTHEVAHLMVWEQHKKKSKPHGKEWKQAFQKLLLPLFDRQIFPADVEETLKKYIANPKASSCTDAQLMKALRIYDEKSSKPLLEELQINTLFNYNGRIFQKGARQRKRYKCKEIATRKVYLFNPIVEVEAVA